MEGGHFAQQNGGVVTEDVAYRVQHIRAKALTQSTHVHLLDFDGREWYSGVRQEEEYRGVKGALICQLLCLIP